MPASVFAHLMMLLFAAAIAILGWYVAHNPIRALRFFSFGMEPALGKKFGAAFCKACGWTLSAVMGVGVIFYLVLILMDIAHRR